MSTKKFTWDLIAILILAVILVIPVVGIYIIFYASRPHGPVVDLVFIGIIVLVIFILARTIVVIWQAKKTK